VVVDKSNKAGVFWLFFGEGGIGEVLPEIAMNNEGMFFENRTQKNAKKNLMQSRVVIEKIQVEVLNKNKIRKKPTCSDLFRMFVC